MRLLFVQQDIGLWGASQSLIALIECLREKGHACLVLLPQDCLLAKELDSRQIDYRIAPRRTWTYLENGRTWRRLLSGAWSLASNVRCTGPVMEVAREFRPDVVHTNSSKTPFGAILARRLKVPHVWHFREFLGGPFSCGLTFSLGRRLTGGFVRGFSSAAVVISKALGDHVRLDSNRVATHVVYNGVMPTDTMRATVRTPLPAPSPLVLAWVGRFETYKHPFVALEAVRILQGEGRNVKLIMAGEGQEELTRQIERYIAEHELEGSVETCGYVADIGRVYARSHALVMCSVADAFGRVTAEAMAYARPVIGADACATSELVEDHVTGLLFRPGNAGDLAGKIRLLIEQPALIGRLGANAALKAQRDFTVEKYAHRMEEIFQSVVPNIHA